MLLTLETLTKLTLECAIGLIVSLQVPVVTVTVIFIQHEVRK